MDPPPDLLPDPLTPPPPFPVPAPAVAANPTPSHPPPPDHPPYSEMITAAISALKERNGSSKRAIAKYIETHYPNLPVSHPGLLTHNLKRLKSNGQLLMVKQSYKLPGSASVTVNGAFASDPASAVTKRRPGRPPKPKPDSVQPPVPVFAPSVDMNALPAPPALEIGQENAQLASGQVNGPPSVRGRGRPPKRAKRGPGRPPKLGVVTSARGRPKKNAILAARKKGLGRPRGRPPKPVNAVQGVAPGPTHGVGMDVASAALGAGIAPVGVKRRGRPPKAGGVAKKPRSFSSMQPEKQRNLSGRPLGRPKKNQSKSSDSQLLVAYLDLKTKLENLQSKVQQTVAFVKPSVNNEAAFNALQELEQVATNISEPLNVQQQQPPPLPEPPHLQPPFP